VEAVVDAFYDEVGSLFVEAYDAFYSSSDPHLGPLLVSTACPPLRWCPLAVARGTGRIALPLARARLTVIGIDRSEPMIVLKAREPARIMVAIGDKTANRWHLQVAQRWVVQYNVYINDSRWGRVFRPRRRPPSRLISPPMRRKSALEPV
jgi:hypothetical protein